MIIKSVVKPRVFIFHLANVWVFNVLRRNAVFQQQTELPVDTDEWTEVAPR